MRLLRWVLPVVVLLGGLMVVLRLGSTDRTDGRSIERAAALCPDRAVARLDHVACLGAAILESIERDGAVRTVQTLRAYIELDPDRLSACHDAAHWAARRIVSTDAVAALVAADDGSCDFGLTHGALEGLSEIADEGVFREMIRTVCAPVATGILRHNCGHGIGHALAIRYGGTFQSMLERCATLVEADQEGCVSAVVMTYTTENASLAAEVRVDVDRVPPDAIPTVCDGSSGTVAIACWQAVTDLYPREPLETILPSMLSACTAADRAGYGFECRTGLGQALYFRYDPELGTDAADVLERFTRTAPLCPAGAGRGDCITGLSSAAAAWWRSLRPAFDGFPDICATLDLAVSETCDAVVATWAAQAAQG